MRRGALLKDAQFICRLPTSVAGGEKAPGNWLDMAGLLGPGSVALDGLFKVLIAPCGGTSGLPYDWARAFDEYLVPSVNERYAREEQGDERR